MTKLVSLLVSIWFFWLLTAVSTVLLIVDSHGTSTLGALYSGALLMSTVWAIDSTVIIVRRWGRAREKSHP